MCNENEKLRKSLSNDKVFKNVFMEERFLLPLLKELEIVTEDVNDFVIENSVDDTGISLKSSIYDLKVSMLDNNVQTFATIEMQNQKPSYDLMDRFVLYLAKSIARSNPKSDSYKKMNNYVIAFLNFPLIEEDSYISVFTLNNKKHTELINYKIVVVQLTKANECDKTSLREWLEIFNAYDVEPFKEKGGVMKQLAEKLQQLNKDRIFQGELDSQELHEKHILTEMENAKKRGLAEGRAEGRAEGKAEGIIEGKAEGILQGFEQATLELAKNMKENGLDISLIMKITKLDKTIIESL